MPSNIDLQNQSKQLICKKDNVSSIHSAYYSKKSATIQQNNIPTKWPVGVFPGK